MAIFLLRCRLLRQMPLVFFARALCLHQLLIAASRHAEGYYHYAMPLFSFLRYAMMLIFFFHVTLPMLLRCRLMLTTRFRLPLLLDAHCRCRYAAAAYFAAATPYASAAFMCCHATMILIRFRRQMIRCFAATAFAMLITAPRHATLMPRELLRHA